MLSDRLVEATDFFPKAFYHHHLPKPSTILECGQSEAAHLAFLRNQQYCDYFGSFATSNHRRIITCDASSFKLSTALSPPPPLSRAQGGRASPTRQNGARQRQVHVLQPPKFCIRPSYLAHFYKTNSPSCTAAPQHLSETIMISVLVFFLSLGRREEFPRQF